MVPLELAELIAGEFGLAFPNWAWLSLLLAVLALIFIPKVQARHVREPIADGKARFDSENEARKTLAQILGGFFVLGGLYLSVSTLSLSREGQIADRYTKAIDQLASSDMSGEPKIEVRIGGIYGLKLIAREADYHNEILEILTTYVRNQSPRRTNGLKSHTTQIDDSQKRWSGTRPDVQAALTVLATRTPQQRDEKLDLRDSDLRGTTLSSALLPDSNLSSTDLSNANMEQAKLKGANLSSAIISNADLREADLSGAHLARANLINAFLDRAQMEKADLTEADLRAASLYGAFLSNASLTEANLAGADLRWAKLGGADFAHANLSATDLGGADLQEARNLTQKQIDSASGDSKTKLPPLMRMPPGWNTPSSLKAVSRPTFGADPNPVTQTNGWRQGATTLQWKTAAKKTEVRVNSPGGTLFCKAESGVGNCKTGLWVTDGTTFYLQDANSSAPTSGAATLSVVTVRVQ